MCKLILYRALCSRLIVIFRSRRFVKSVAFLEKLLCAIWYRANPRYKHSYIISLQLAVWTAAAYSMTGKVRGVFERNLARSGQQPSNSGISTSTTFGRCFAGSYSRNDYMYF